MNDQELCQKAWAILSEHLGAVEALRFLSIARREPRDYQQWRHAQFGDRSVAELMREIEARERRE